MTPLQEYKVLFHLLGPPGSPWDCIYPLLPAYSSATLKFSSERFSTSFKEDSCRTISITICLPPFSASMSQCPQHRWARGAVSLGSGKVWRHKLSPQRPALLRCIQSTQASSVCVSAKASACRIPYQSKRGSYVPTRGGSSSRTHCLYCPGNILSCALCALSLMHRLGYLRPIETETGLLSNTLPCWSDSPQE